MHKDPLQPGEMYHLFNRGNAKENLFKEIKNYSHFLKLWKKHVLSVADTYCYSLQPNHFHFLVETKGELMEEQIKQALSNFFNAYSKSINKAYHRTGSLFQERFGRKMIESEEQCTEVIFYIHSNAEKHGLIKDFRNYPYSSYQSILSSRPTSLARSKVLDWFGGKQSFIDFHNSRREWMLDYLKVLDITLDL